MTRIYSILMIILAASLYQCSSSEPYQGMPSAITEFIAQYYPDTAVDSFTSTDQSYTVILKNGPSIIFDDNCKWVRIDGNGSTLPKVLLFNDFPPDLYNYLQETENTLNVFCVSRNRTSYTVELLDETIVYNIETGKINGEK